MLKSDRTIVRAYLDGIRDCLWEAYLILSDMIDESDVEVDEKIEDCFAKVYLGLMGFDDLEKHIVHKWPEVAKKES